jgi:hypothetical protein
MHFDDIFDATGGSLFEPVQCILALSLAASFCFVFFACSRWIQLQKACIKIDSSHRANIKVVSARCLKYMSGTNLLINLKAFNLILLVFQSSIVGVSISVPTESSHVLAEVAHLVAVVGLVNLSPREHYRSVSPSKPLVVYLSIRTFSNVSALLLVHDRGFTILQTLRAIIEAGVLIAESQNKRHYLLEPFVDIAPEDTAGLWSKASFAWVTPILLAGNDHWFSSEKLPRNPHRFDPSSLRQTILLTWNQRGELISCMNCVILTNLYSQTRKSSDIAIDLGPMSHARVCYYCAHEVHAYCVALRSATSYKQNTATFSLERFGWAIVPALMHYSHHLNGSLHWTSCTISRIGF